MNTKEPSHFAFIGGAKRKCRKEQLGFILFSSLVFSMLRFILSLDCYLHPPIKKNGMSGKVINGHSDAVLFFKRNSGILFTFNRELRLAVGRHFGTKAENELPCAPKIDGTNAAGSKYHSCNLLKIK